MRKIVDFLKGKKSYIVGILMIVLGLLQNDNTLVMQGLSVITLRACIGKVTK